FLNNAPPIRRALIFFLDEPRQLHGQRRCTPTCSPPYEGPRSRGQGQGINTVMIAKPAVFRLDDRLDQRWRYLGQGKPVTTTASVVGTNPLQRKAITVHDQHV